MDMNNQNQNPMQEAQYQQNLNASYAQEPKHKSPIMKVLAMLGSVAVGIVGVIVLVFAVISVVSANSNKLVCKSNEGNITIVYDDEIVGYIAEGMSYDYDQQKSIAEQIGIQSYLDEFKTWFETNTTGSCLIEEK